MNLLHSTVLTRATDTVIRTEGLSKRYGASRLALDRLDLSVRRGEVFGFLGPNGAGKSTTMRLLLDLIHPTGGTATIFGLDCHRDSLAIRRRISYLPGDLRLPAREIARAFLVNAAWLHGSVAPGRIVALAERLQLDLSRPMGKLSRGNRQKVGLILAFMADPDLLILDEPTSGLDPLVQRTFQEMVLDARQNGQTVFLSSHTLPEVERIADRVAILKAGRLVTVDSMREIRERALHRIDIQFAARPDPDAFRHLAGVRDVSDMGDTLAITVAGSMDDVVKEAARHTVRSVNTHDTDLEEIFMDLYRPEAVASDSRTLEASHG